MSIANNSSFQAKKFNIGEGAPKGNNLNTKGWQQEAVLRMLLNNLDKDVAERPEDLVVYGGRGKAARSLKDFNTIIQALEELENDETLLVQSRSAVARIKTGPGAPRV